MLCISIVGGFISPHCEQSVLDNLRGGVPMMAKKILQLLFDQTDNLAGGFHVKRPDGSMRPIRARFKGFLADEKGLK